MATSSRPGLRDLGPWMKALLMALEKPQTSPLAWASRLNRLCFGHRSPNQETAWTCSTIVATPRRWNATERQPGLLAAGHTMFQHHRLITVM